MWFARLPWHERLVLFTLIVLIAWESILAAYKFSEFPYSAVDFFQHWFLGRFINEGGSVTDPGWPQRVGDSVGLHLPPSLQRTAPYLHYQLLVLPLFRALALLPMSAAYAVWLIGNLLLLAWTGSKLAAEIGVKKPSLWFALFLWPPIWHVLILGNVDSLVWVLMNWGWIHFLRHREGMGGFWMGMATLMKGFPVFAAIPWLIGKPGPTLRGFAGGILTGILWGTVWSGVEGWRFMIQHIPDYQQALASFMPANNSLLAVLWAFLGPPIRTERGISYQGFLSPGIPPADLSALHLFASFLLLALAWRSVPRSPSAPPMVQSGAWLALGLFLWPVSWINYHIYLFAPLAGLIAHRELLSRSTRLLLYGAIFPITAALSYGFLANVTAPWMLMPILLGGTRLLLFEVFRRSIREIHP
ncbi:MAG: DUF2029 domain-containing protein [Thermoflexus sp.]|uniref:glycosyltransferase family 87 protein n=2 Tax=Thermoflexus sp. TaxID=1969742 RepID=UPI0025FA9B6C|nr:glycosyltransferase family 87 protein [Thermoflexus sp.]MCS6963376.1 DUF2029 domain-containing protein [Thermoflexus sp.]